MLFLHAADIHLDSPLTGLPEYEGAPTEAIRGATREAFSGMVTLAIERSCDFVVIAGDLYDGNWKSYDTGLFFVREMARLSKAGIPAFVLYGNHDAESRITKRLELPPNVKTFSARKPETHRLDDIQVALHGQSFKSRHVDDNLALTYPDPVDDFFNIGVLHTAATGREGHAPYAPCSVDDLKARGYDYWALGHVHARELLLDDPPILFPGNLQGRHVREEAADGKGCTLVSVDRESGYVELEHVAVDTVRWRTCSVDLAGAAEIDEVYDRVREAIVAASEEAHGRLLATRVVLSGRTALHGRLVRDSDSILNNIRAGAISAASGDVWIEKVKVGTAPEIDIAALGERGDTLGDVARALQEIGAESESNEALRAELEAIFKKLPPDAFERFPDLEALRADAESLAAVIEQASLMVLSDLAGAGDDS